MKPTIEKGDRPSDTAPLVSLKELRRAATDLTQTQVADALKISTQAVSRIEREDDMLLSTLRNYIKALRGILEVTVRLPGYPAARIESLNEIILLVDSTDTVLERNVPVTRQDEVTPLPREE